MQFTTRQRYVLPFATALFVSLLGCKETPAQTETPAQAIAYAPVTDPKVDSTQLLTDVRVLTSDSLEGRGVNTNGGAKARRYLKQRLMAIGIAPLGAEFEQPFNTKKQGVNLLGVIRGTAHPDSFIVISAHYDHMGIMKGELYPGADDNASGVGAVLAAATWLKQHPPKHSVIIALFDGEEHGLLGAKAFVEAAPVPLKAIKLNLNLDMVGRNVQGELYVCGTRPYPFLKPVVDAVAAQTQIKLPYGHDGGDGKDSWIQSSDHGPFHTAGIPFLYLGVEDHPDYHKPTDTFERLMPAFYYRTADVVVKVLLSADERL